MASEDKDNASLASRCTCTVLPVAGSLMKHHYSELSNQLNELCSCSSRKQQIICEIEEAQSPLVTLPTRSRSDSFARILSYRVGIKDLTMGAKLVQNAGTQLSYLSSLFSLWNVLCRESRRRISFIRVPPLFNYAHL